MNRGRRFGSGKLPLPVLTRLLESLTSVNACSDPAIVTGPAPGRDSAALDTGSRDLLIVSGDPITFTAERIGELGSLINANDVATVGAVPRWFFTTLLLPPESEEDTVESLFQDLDTVCQEHAITLIGGHTEITDAVSRPVLAGTMLGTVSRDRYIDIAEAGEGDALLITKELAMEGSAVLARELGDVLVQKGLNRDELSEADEYFRHISIVEEALLAASTGWITGMHDITEGGVAAALLEFALASGRTVQCTPATIPVSAVTRRICSILGIDPLGLLGSGSLIISCKIQRADDLAKLLHQNGIAAKPIGTLGKKGDDPTVLTGDGTPFPEFEVDEIAGVLGAHLSADPRE